MSAVDDYEGEDFNGEEGHPGSEAVVNSFHELNVDDSEGKAASIQEFKH